MLTESTHLQRLVNLIIYVCAISVSLSICQVSPKQKNLPARIRDAPITKGCFR